MRSQHRVYKDVDNTCSKYSPINTLVHRPDTQLSLIKPLDKTILSYQTTRGLDVDSDPSECVSSDCFFNRALIAVLTHILFVKFFSLFVLHLQVDVVVPLLLNAGLHLVLTTDYSEGLYI